MRGDEVEVEFLEALGLGKRQLIPAAEFRPEWDLVFDDDEEGLCEMCEREAVLTFHHLLPKQAHKQLLRSGATPESLGLLGVELPEGDFKTVLGQYGSMLCRPCHSAVHRFADNFELASTYNTTEKLMQEPDIQKWVRYAKRTRAMTKEGAGLVLARRSKGI